MGVYPFLVKTYEPGAKKRFGQHFLRDTGVIDRIVRWIDPAPADVVVEIGAGDGAISTRLAPKVGRLIAVEIDPDRIPQLEASLAPYPSAVLIPGDFLRIDLDASILPYMQPGARLRVAGNLPYNVATAMIERLLKWNVPVQDMFFMVQLEVARRIAAVPGTREYGVLSVFCQHYCDVQTGFKVSRACFVPRPQVDSSMISLRPRGITTTPKYEAAFEEIVKAAFNYRRKTLANSLTRHPVLGKAASELLAGAAIDGSRRAEELSLQEFETLARVYREMRAP